MRNYEDVDMFAVMAQSEAVKKEMAEEIDKEVLREENDNEVIEEELDNDECDTDEGIDEAEANGEVEDGKYDEEYDDEDEGDNFGMVVKTKKAKVFHCEDCGKELTEEEGEGQCEVCYEKGLLPLRDSYKGFTEETLKDAPHEVLVELLHMSHPDERHSGCANNGVYDKDWNATYERRTEAYDIGRGAVLSEISARGERILHELGYPTKLSQVYVNIHAGCEETYGDLLKGWRGGHAGYQGLRCENWHLLEVYKPLEVIGRYHEIRLRYLKGSLEEAIRKTKDKSSGMGSYYKQDIERLKKDVAREEIKINNRRAEDQKKVNDEESNCETCGKCERINV